MSLQTAYILTILLQTESGGGGGWWLFLLGLLALVGFLYWFRQASEEDLAERIYQERHYPLATAMPPGFMVGQTAVLPTTEPSHDHDAHDTVGGHEAEAHDEADDLTMVEGIGPKIAGLLQEAGIGSYEKLASSEADALRAILAAAGAQFQLADPTTWPQQAQLLADGETEKLVELQAQLKGGRQTN